MSENAQEKLAMLYLEQKDISEYTPEKLVDEYCETLLKIKDAYKIKKKAELKKQENQRDKIGQPFRR